MATQLDIFVGNETLIDFDVYQLWLAGHSVSEAAKLQQKKGCLLLYGATFEMLLSEVADQFRTFLILEGYLKNPSQLSFQLEFQLTPEVQDLLIERYYRLDSSVARELIGRKLSARVRGSLDEVADKCLVSVKSCRRQFDNIKSIFKCVEDQPGHVVKNICQLFLLSECLSRKYAAVVFLNTNRFDLNKKKLGHVTFEQLVHCSCLIMQHWTRIDTDADMNDTDLDRDLLHELKDLKGLMDRDTVEEHKEHFMKAIKKKVSQEFSEEFAKLFKNLSKSTCSIGSNLTQGKELRDLFVGLHDKVIEPSLQLQHSTKENFRICLQAFQTTFPFVHAVSKSPRAAVMATTWKRLMDVLNGCLLQLYPE